MASVECSDCGKAIDEPSDLDPAFRQPCPDCGSTARTVVVTASDQTALHVYESVVVKGSRPGATGKRKWLSERFSGADWSHRRQRFVHKERTIDRENDHYAERVVDPETGEVLRDVDEPLSEHRGRGSAKARDTGDQPPGSAGHTNEGDDRDGR